MTRPILAVLVLAISIPPLYAQGTIPWDAYEHEQCTAVGYQRGTPLYLQCRSMVAQARLARQTNALQGATIGLQMMSRPAAPPPVPPNIRCVTTPTGGGTTTTRCD
jgi:hypothetical protein